MHIHTVVKGDIIRSKKHSPIWIDIGEIFTVEGIIYSETGAAGVLFIDRYGGQRAFWNPNEYEPY